VVKWRLTCKHCGETTVTDGCPEACDACGRPVEHHPPSEFKNAPARTAGGQWPMLSDAAGVHPDEIDQARSEALHHGVPTDFSPDGRAIFTSRAHRRKYCRSIGMHDNDGGYGDP